MSSVEEIISDFARKKATGELSLSEIKHELKTNHNFSEEEFQLIISAIQDKEFDLVTNQASTLSKIGQSQGIALFFLIFALVATIVSILTIWKNSEIEINMTPIQKYLPWIILIGSVFLIMKHGQRLFKK